MTKAELLAYLRGHKLAVVGSIGPDGAPQAALVGVAVTNEFEVVFDTVTTSRKHANIRSDPRVSVTWSGPGEQTVQYEGRAAEVGGPEAEPYKQAYYQAWPDGPSRANWPNLAYIRVRPVWARYSDYDRGPLIAEFAWPSA